MKLILFIVTLISLTSCSYFKGLNLFSFGKESCNQSSSFLDGARQAGKRLPSMPLKSAEKCGKMESYTPQNYIYDYEKGYNARMKEQCSLERAGQLGRFAAQRLDLSENELMRYKICESVGVSYESLRQRYLLEFGKIYCSEKKAKELAKHTSARLLKMDKNFLMQCRGASRYKLERTYDRVYNQGIARTCNKGAIAQKAMADVRYGLSLKEGIKTVSRCLKRNRRKYRKIYESNFRFELGRIERLALIKNLDKAQQQIILEESKVDFQSGNYDLYTLCEVSKGQAKGILLPVQHEELNYTGAFEIQYFKRPDYTKIKSSLSGQSQSYQNVLIKRVRVVSATFPLTVDGVIIAKERAPRGADLCKVIPR